MDREIAATQKLLASIRIIEMLAQKEVIIANPRDMHAKWIVLMRSWLEVHCLVLLPS